MNTKSVLGVVLAFGVAFSLLAGSGLGPGVFGEAPGDQESVKTVGEIGENASVDKDDEAGGLRGDVAGDDEPTLVGLAIDAGLFIVRLVAAVALLPFILIRLGFPEYFAFPVGGIAQIIAFIGLAQFVRTGELK